MIQRLCPSGFQPRCQRLAGCEIRVDPVGEGGGVFVGVEQVASAAWQTALAVDPAYLTFSRKPLVDQAFDSFEQCRNTGFSKGMSQDEKTLFGVRLFVFLQDHHTGRSTSVKGWFCAAFDAPVKSCRKVTPPAHSVNRNLPNIDNKARRVLGYAKRKPQISFEVPK